MITDATGFLLAACRNSTATDAEIDAAAQSFLDAIGQASLDELNDAMRRLSQHLDIADMSRGAYLAMICRELVERGCDPLIIAGPLINALRTLLKLSAELADACAPQLPETQDEDQDSLAIFENNRTTMAAKMPRHDAAWNALRQFWPPAIVVLSVSPESRAKAHDLRELAASVASYHEGGHWLRLILSVLVNEPILVIEPQRGVGILGRISGVVENFQLNVLIMDAFPRSGIFSRRRVSQWIADVARGKGPQQTDDTVTAVWNLYTWQGIKPGFVLPDPNDWESTRFWIWNEGLPEDIPLFEGYRVVLLGPASYPRSWRSQRMFDKLSAHLECERTLTKDEVSDWLHRMTVANAAG
jgi:hypothetical protein